VNFKIGRNIMDKAHRDKMRTASLLLSDPGGEVVRECLDEINRLHIEIHDAKVALCSVDIRLRRPSEFKLIDLAKAAANQIDRVQGEIGLVKMKLRRLAQGS
jgi:hypothetical protein